jgi:hypothetical protein
VHARTVSEVTTTEARVACCAIAYFTIAYFRIAEAMSDAEIMAESGEVTSRTTA